MADTDTDPHRRPDLEEAVLDLIEAGATLAKAVAKLGLNRRLVHRWRRRYPDFDRGYWLAKQAQVENEADSCLEIARAAKGKGLPAISQARLEIDTIKWRCAKLFPRIYGDKVAHQIGGDEANPLRVIIQRFTPEPDGD